MQNKYEKKAADFLAKTGVTFNVKFIHHAKHFTDDRETRDIFRFVFRRGRNSYSGLFGQSLQDSTGAGKITPTPYDVLACLVKSDPGTFEQFCDSYGYNKETPTARKVYKASLKEWVGVKRIWSIAEIEHDLCELY